MTSKGFHTAERQGDAAHHYVLAGQPVVFESRVMALEAYRIGAASERFSELLLHFREPKILNASNSRLTYHGQAPFDNQQRRVRFWRSGRRAQIDIDTEPVCQIDFEGSHIHLLDAALFDTPVNLEVVTGPALVLLLAELGVYCLHAGAVSTSAGNIGLIAESGVGKSTLAKHVDAQWQQISDDTLPVGLPSKDMQRPELYADFPQLKLQNAAVKIRAEPGAKLSFLLRISPEPTQATVFKKMDRAASMLQIIRHTVAAKLFDQTLMKQHADFAKHVSKGVPMLEVSYPRSESGLADLRNEIVAAFTKFHSHA